MKIARLRNKGELELKNEIIEYPSELAGNRNLFTGLYTGHANHPNYNINNWTGAVVKIKPNTTYTVKRWSDSNRFQVMTGNLDNGIYAKMTGTPQVVGDYNENHVDVSLTITSREDDEYLVAYLSNQGHFEDILLKVEEGNKATQYTPSPEELGLDYPDFIKKFNQKIHPEGIFLTPEIIEFPDADSFGIRAFGDMTMVSELIEDCSFKEWFWLDFVPYDESTSSSSKVRVNSQIIPYDCTLHMSLVGNQQHECYWYINGKSLRARKMITGGGEWTDNQSISISAGDELYIEVSTTLTTTTIEDTLILRLDDENGIKVAEFDFVLEPTCYLTTAMVGYFNKADDGIELTAMRELRSHSGYKYQDVLEEYAQISPIIIRGIEQSEDRDYYYNMIKDVVDNIVIWGANEEWEKAETAYLDLYYYLKERFEVV
ncbi:MAG: hypothetical protein GX787_08120 [Tissierellia bacterium]|nr:hypothetical protein [Tissierellia bacterium]